MIKVNLRRIIKKLPSFDHFLPSRYVKIHWKSEKVMFWSLFTMFCPSEISLQRLTRAKNICCFCWSKGIYMGSTLKSELMKFDWKVITWLLRLLRCFCCVWDRKSCRFWHRRYNTFSWCIGCYDNFFFSKSCAGVLWIDGLVCCFGCFRDCCFG